MFEVIIAIEEYGAKILGVKKPNWAMDGHTVTVINGKTKKPFDCGYVSTASIPKIKGGCIPGELIQCIHGSVASRYLSMGKDPHGNLSWILMRSKNKNLLCVVTACRVCQKEGTNPAGEDYIISHLTLTASKNNDKAHISRPRPPHAGSLRSH